MCCLWLILQIKFWTKNSKIPLEDPIDPEQNSSYVSHICLLVAEIKSHICICLPPDRTWHKINDSKVDYGGD